MVRKNETRQHIGGSMEDDEKQIEKYEECDRSRDIRDEKKIREEIKRCGRSTP